MLRLFLVCGCAALIVISGPVLAQTQDKDATQAREQQRGQFDQRPDQRERDSVFLPNDGGLYHRARDAVRWAGHRCDTVHTVEITGGAYLVTCSSGPYWLVDRGVGLRVLPARPGTAIEQPALTIR